MNILAARIATLEAQGIRFCSLADLPDIHSVYNENTGALRAYRGRKIGQAMNVMAARYARQLAHDRSLGLIALLGEKEK